MSEETDRPSRADGCPECGTPVCPRPADDARRTAALERGSCTGCGLQLVRNRDAPWREIRG
ncbi:MAG TPA: hypothetical protein VMN58_09540 [Acidimicrobiales bacterium]|nr:hypothetical protein [Acidimicrobiales bacterium]